MGHVGLPDAELLDVVLAEVALPEVTLFEAGSQVERRRVNGSGLGVGEFFGGEREASANALTGFEKLE